MWEERADDGTGEPAARAVLPVVAGIVRPRRASVARDSTADRRRGHSSGVPKPVRADRPPLDFALDPEEYKRRLRAKDRTEDGEDQDPGNRAVNFRGEKRSNATHRSTTDPDCRFVSKGSSGTGAYPGYTVNALMENRHRFLL